MRYGDRERKDGLRRAVVRKRKKKKNQKKFQTHITQKRHAICFPLNEEKKALFSFFVSLSFFALFPWERKRGIAFYCSPIPGIKYLPGFP